MAKQTIDSPLPGIFYHRSSPDEAPYKSKEDEVTAGDVIGLVEVMKSFHEIKATAGGVFSGYIAENEAAVQAGQPLAEIDG